MSPDKSSFVFTLPHVNIGRSSLTSLRSTAHIITAVALNHFFIMNATQGNSAEQLSYVRRTHVPRRPCSAVLVKLCLVAGKTGCKRWLAMVPTGFLEYTASATMASFYEALFRPTGVKIRHLAEKEHTVIS